MIKKRNGFIDRTGEKHITSDGYQVEIIEYFNNDNCTILFENGIILVNKNYRNIKKGRIDNPKHRIGEIWMTNEGYEMEIIEFFSYKNITVKLKDGNILYNVGYGYLNKGQVKNPYHLSVHGVGYLGVGEYSSRVNREKTKLYYTWANMIKRGHSNTFKLKNPTYKEVKVCEEWHNFQVFAEWHEENCKYYMQDWELDKDILIKGNKIYSPETCCFVPKEINNLFPKRDKCRGLHPIGVTYHKRDKIFEANVSTKNGKTYLGAFNTAEEAFQVYKVVKEREIKKVADKWYNVIPKKVYQAMYNYQVEITD